MRTPAALLLTAAVGCQSGGEPPATRVGAAAPAKVEAAGPPESPTHTVVMLLRSQRNGDAQGFWDRLDERSHKMFERQANELRAVGESPLGAGDGLSLLKYSFEKTKERDAKIEKERGNAPAETDPDESRSSEVINGERAIVTRFGSNGMKVDINLVLENNKWRVCWADVMDGVNAGQRGNKSSERKP